MEEIKISTPKNSKSYCENDSCFKPRIHYCSDHNQMLCNSCFTALHVRCRCDKIPGQVDIEECLGTVKSLFKSVNEVSELLRAGSYIKCFKEEFKTFNGKLAEVDEKFTSAVKNKNIYEFSAIMKEVLQIQKEFTESNSFTEFAKFKELKLVAAGGCLSSQVKDDQQRNCSLKKLAEYREQVLKVMEEDNTKKVRQLAKEMSEQIVNQINNTVELLKVKIQDQEQSKRELEEKHKKLNKEFKEQADILKKHKQVIDDEERKQKEKEEQIKEKKGRLRNFDKIYKRNFGGKISDIPNFDLEISLDYEKQKSMMKDCVASKYRLPDIQGIQIDCISDADADLASFLSNCTPDHIKSLKVNNNWKSKIGIKSKFYVEGFSKAVERTSELVYFGCIDFSAEDLQTIIRAAHNVEKIVFYFCCIHCSSDLDFGTDLSYKTKVISFWGCGSTDCEERTTDWKLEPSSFSLIVDAIASSGLKSSLQEINIECNQTLDASEIQAELNEKGMSSISVVK